MYTVLNVNLLYCIYSVQVTSDSSIHDNTYTGQICYVKIGTNRWEQTDGVWYSWLYRILTYFLRYL